MSMDQRRVGKALGVVGKDPTGTPRALAERIEEIAEKARDLRWRLDQLQTKYEDLRDRSDPDEWQAALDELGWASDDWGDMMA